MSALLTGKPAFKTLCPQCSKSLEFIGGIIFDLFYKGRTLFFFVAITF